MTQGHPQDAGGASSLSAVLPARMLTGGPRLFKAPQLLQLGSAQGCIGA